MSQRTSGYERREGDLYETPAWVTRELSPHLPAELTIWEPACGTGKMVDALRMNGRSVYGTDIAEGLDFLFLTVKAAPHANAIVTNPPYGLATEFIEHALGLMEACGGIVAMLLRTDFDHAISREHLFGGNRSFAKKLVLTKRIRWFEGTKGSPSFNHAWFIWDWKHEGAPTLAYAP